MRQVRTGPSQNRYGVLGFGRKERPANPLRSVRRMPLFLGQVEGKAETVLQVQHQMKFNLKLNQSGDRKNGRFTLRQYNRIVPFNIMIKVITESR